MDRDLVTERPMTPEEVRAYLWQWIVSHRLEAERLGRRAMGNLAGLEPGDALSVVEEAAEVVAELAARRPVYLSGLLGLLTHQVRWVAARRARVLRPRWEIPSGLGRTDVSSPETSTGPADHLSLALMRRQAPMLSEEVRAASALAMIEGLSLRLRVSLMAGVDGLASRLQSISPIVLASTPGPPSSTWRKRVERGREAMLRWASAGAVGAERELLALLARRGRQAGYRDWRVRLLEQLGLDPVGDMARSWMRTDPARLSRPGPVGS
ncbi:MAG TPA: hypothetical protein VKY90_22015 [Candidatus Dormibacteraeota bacterium]|nr:hypothetical protein [Candidatus Dormibacteraeota bacterium]